MQTCAETLNWGPDHSLWSLEDPTRMGTTWQFPVWIIMFFLLNVSHALSISMIIIFTLQPTLKYKWRYMLLNSCHAPPQNQPFFTGDAGTERFVIWHASAGGTRKARDAGTIVGSELPLLCQLLWKHFWMKSLKHVEELTLSQRGTNKWVIRKGGGSHCKFSKITGGEETSAAAQGWNFSMTSAVHQAAAEEWRGAVAPISLTVWFKELFFAGLALCLSVALKGRENHVSARSLAFVLKIIKKKKKGGEEGNIKGTVRLSVGEFSTLNPLVSHWVTRQQEYFTVLLHMICLHLH